VTDCVQVGWREWITLPDLAVPWIKAKVDTGARTSALNAQDIQPFERDASQWVSFRLRPSPADDQSIACEMPIHEFRDITDSGGNTERRPVIRTEVQIGTLQSIIDITLTDRSTMRFSMLLGRTALPADASVWPRRSFLLGGDRFAPPEIQ
jgi:hypothetical protein